MRFHEGSAGGTARTHRIGGIALLTLMLVPTAPAFGAPLYIDFGSHSAAPSSQLGAAADVAGAWNSVSAPGTMSDLLDILGHSSDVSITVAAEGMNLLLPDILAVNGTLTAARTRAGGLSGLAGMQRVATAGAPMPVPEPGTLALLAAALATTTFRSRRLRR